MKELKSFYISFSIFSCVFPLILYFKVNHKIAVVVFCVLMFILLISFINKIFAENLHLLMSEIGSFLGDKITILVLFFVYVIAIIPTKFLMLLCKRDRLKIKKENNDSYWIDVKEEKQNWDLQY